MRKLNIQFKYDEVDLEKAIEFMMGNKDHVEAVRNDYFPESKIVVDMTKIEDPAKRTYMFNSLAAALITIQEATREPVKEPEPQSRIITLSN